MAAPHRGGEDELLRRSECGEVVGARRADLLDFPKQLWFT